MKQEQSGNYPVDAENVAEMARLTRQARVFTSSTGLLPPNVQLATGQSVLDVACGPGEWTLAVAEQYPHVQVVGIDISTTMTDYARYLAAERELLGVSFRVMDARQGLAFPDAAFDVVHTRLISGFLTPESWPVLLAECARVLKPGGSFISVETNDVGSSTSPALTQLMSVVMRAMHRTGHYFGAESDHSGVAVVLPRLLREAGLTNVGREAFVLDSSSGSAAHEELVQDWAIVFQIGAPLWTSVGGVSEGELATLSARALEEMRSPDFCAAMFVQRLLAKKA
ncbi:MAG: class I SAM-dependent methyltransferase [Ktedonobacteraceae bacterium]|nr:class I SAM-dependent methyltransferase [Ktedonobacteraceae bacterium]